MHIHPGQPNQQAMGGHPRTPQQQHPLPQQHQQRPQQPPQAQLTADQQRHLDAQQHQQKLQREQAQQQQLQARERQQQQTLALQRQQQQEYQRQQSLIQHAQTVQTLSLRDEQPTPEQARERLSTYAVFRFEQAGSFPGSRVSGGGVEHYCSSDDSSDDDDGWHRKKKSKKRTVHSTTTTKKKKAASPWIDARRIPIPDFKREDVVREIRRLDRETKSLIEKKARLSNEKQRHLELTLDELRRVNAALDVEGNYETNLVQLDDQMPVVVKKHVVEHHDHHHHRRKESRERSRRHGRDGENVKIVSLFGVYQKRPLPSRRREERGRERKSSSHVHEVKVRKEMMEPTSITAFFKTSPRHDVDVMALYYQVEAQKDARRLEAQQQQYWLEQQQQQFQQQQFQQQQQLQQQQKQQQPQQQQQKPQQQQQQPKQQQNRQDDLQHHGVQILNPQNHQKDKKPDHKDQKAQKGEQPRQGQQYQKQQPNHKDDHHTRHRSPSHHRSPHHRHRSPHRHRHSSSRSSSSSSRHSQTFSARDSVSSTLSFPSRDSKDGDHRRAYNQHKRYSEGHFGIVEPGVGRTFQRRESLPYHHHRLDGPEMRRIAPVVNVEQIEANAYHAGRADERLETREMIATVAAAAGAGPKAVVSRHRRVGSAPVPQIVYAQAPQAPGARRLRMVGELEEEDSEDEEEGWSESGGDDSSEDYGVVMPGERRVYPVPRAPPPGRRSGAVVMEERMGGRVRMVRGADVQQAMTAERVERGEKEVVYVRVGQDGMRERSPGLVRPLKGGQRSFERRSPVVENHGGFPFGERNPFTSRPGLERR